ncbi:2-keto-4-pentenoate hydratase [Aquidulcibacter sp.]|jgi:2-keto-4-pentenoate hydratase|uniref:2-keto-4-pentenoate hydratase n=1 Tax=Aquidulcibacter sp. TaxID=2052990 RepID=UPI0028A95A7D|nr:2-keto-4-pentenoate hydratase [Aquidulcibacter sp.]
MQVADQTIVISDLEVDAIAAAFRNARLTNTALTCFPGRIPSVVAESYDIQRAAIASWPDAICGWKVGRILGDLVNVHGADRLIGPIFRKSLQISKGDVCVSFSAIDGGFCAIEPEIVFKLAADAPTSGDHIDAAQAVKLVDNVFVGIEIAGSPLATINELGPCVVVSDFGNNAGLILGPSLTNWRGRLGTIEASTWIDGQLVGTGTDAAFPGGVIQSLVFALNQTAQMGLPIKAGALVSTGAISGVHEIVAGQFASCTFGSDITMKVHCSPARQGKSQ